MTASRFPELGFYTLPGHTRTPADLLDEVREAEALGLGSAWISERFDVKEAAALAGAATAVTGRIHIGTAATNINSRHPMLTAVKTWAAAHLLVNGDLASVVLFGGMLAWAVVAMIGSNRRDGEWVKPEPGTTKGAVMHVVATIVIFAVIIGIHGPLLGVRPIPG